MKSKEIKIETLYAHILKEMIESSYIPELPYFNFGSNFTLD
jgi:hypothetical protein